VPLLLSPLPVGHARVIANVQARLLLFVFYVVVVPPFALIVKAFRDPLALRRPRRATFWVERGSTPSSLETARRQF